jgi:MFS family permease
MDLTSIRVAAARWLDRTGLFGDQDPNIRNLVIDTAWQGLVMGGIFTFISVFVVRLGASSLMVSLLTSLPAVLMVLLSLPAARVIERQTNLVRFTNRVRIFHRLCFLLIALLPFFMKRYLVEAVVVVWALKTVGVAFINSSWTAVVADVIPAERRARVNGGRWALLSLVTALSVAAFGNVLDRVSFPLGYQIVFACSFVGGVAGMIFFGRIEVSDSVPVPKVVAARAHLWGRFKRYVQTLADTPGFVRYLLTTFVLRFGFNLPAALYSIYWIRHLEASDLWIGWQATAGKLALIVGYFFWGRIAARKGHYIVLLWCTLGLGLYPVLTGLIPNQLWLPLVAVVQGLFITGIDLSFFNTLLHVCPRERRPTFIAVNSVFMHLAMGLAPLVGSLLLQWLEVQHVLWIAGALHVVAAILFWRFRVADERGQAPEAHGGTG